VEDRERERERERERLLQALIYRTLQTACGEDVADCCELHWWLRRDVVVQQRHHQHQQQQHQQRRLREIHHRASDEHRHSGQLRYRRHQHHQPRRVGVCQRRDAMGNATVSDKSQRLRPTGRRHRLRTCRSTCRHRQVDIPAVIDSPCLLAAITDRWTYLQWVILPVCYLPPPTGGHTCSDWFYLSATCYHRQVDIPAVSDSPCLLPAATDRWTYLQWVILPVCYLLSPTGGHTVTFGVRYQELLTARRALFPSGVSRWSDYTGLHLSVRGVVPDPQLSTAVTATSLSRRKGDFAIYYIYIYILKPLYN